MTSTEIKRRLKEKGLCQADLCRRWGASSTAISFIVNKKLRSDRFEKQLAKLLGVTLEELRAVNS